LPQPRYVVDTTVLAAWLLKPDGLTGKIIRSLELELYAPYKSVDELWEHKVEWSSRNPDIDITRFVDQLGVYVSIKNVDQGSQWMTEALSIMREIDPDDAEFVGLALMLDVPIWSYDPHYRRQRRVKVVDSRDIVLGSPSYPPLWEALKKEWYALSKRI
jgi:predicted nucleic acid-binding protein